MDLNNSKIRIHCVLQMGTTLISETLQYQPHLFFYFFDSRKHGRLFSADSITAIDFAYTKLLCLDEVTHSQAAQFVSLHREIA